MYANLILVCVCGMMNKNTSTAKPVFFIVIIFLTSSLHALCLSMFQFFCSSQNYSHVSISDVDWYRAFLTFLISILADYDARSFPIDIVQVCKNLIMLCLSFSGWNSIPKGCVKLLTTQINVNVSPSLFWITTLPNHPFGFPFLLFICSMKVYRYLFAT